MIKILFDWNGTLLDDLDYSFQTAVNLQKFYGIPPMPSVAFYQSIFCFPIQEYYRKAGFDFSKIDWNECGHRFMDAYVKDFSKTRLNHQAIEVLQKAKAAGAACYILSASKLDLLKAQIESFDKLNGLIDGVYGISDIFASSKEKAAREFSSTCLSWDEIYVIGDTLHDLESAQAIGAQAILFDGGHQSRKVLEQSGQPVVSSLVKAWEVINARSHH
ncbi:HAD family hydrolase [Erysipelotrichaceae bacterium RD49]|nr:HAD family hydrolase [Erysipelotrichaceae bacterium RD49]